MKSSRKSGEPTQQMSFNRTIIELKSSNGYETAEIGEAFNRTIIELKSANSLDIDVKKKSFNRTIIELKLIMNMMFNI